MKIECDKCGAKYSIADEKVRGKTFKIRCKKCSNVIIVRDKAGGGDAAESEAPADEPGWHLAIGGETVGPLTEMGILGGDVDSNMAVRNPILPANGIYDATVNVVGKDMLVNYKTFKVINKPAGTTISWTWRLTF